MDVRADDKILEMWQLPGIGESVGRGRASSAIVCIHIDVRMQRANPAFIVLQAGGKNAGGSNPLR